MLGGLNEITTNFIKDRNQLQINLYIGKARFFVNFEKGIDKESTIKVLKALIKEMESFCPPDETIYVCK